MFLNFNGQVREEGVALLRPGNRGFRYGDGLFETMLVRQAKVRLGTFHLDRLHGGMELLRLELPLPMTLAVLEGHISELHALNRFGDEDLVRARLTVFRGSDGAFNGPDRAAWYCIEVSGLVGRGRGEDGLIMDLFPAGRKPCDSYSAIKSNSYLLSTQAGLFAKERGLDDCVLLNSYGRVAETTIANIWWVREGRIYTPPLAEGCVAGVMRRRLLELLPAAGYVVQESPIFPDALAAVDEIFISNALQGIQWVRDFGGHAFGCNIAASIKADIISKI